MSTVSKHQHHTAQLVAKRPLEWALGRPLRTRFARRGPIARRRLDARRERARWRALLSDTFCGHNLTGALLEQLASHQHGIGTLTRSARRRAWSMGADIVWSEECFRVLRCSHRYRKPAGRMQHTSCVLDVMAGRVHGHVNFAVERDCDPPVHAHPRGRHQP